MKFNDCGEEGVLKHHWKKDQLLKRRTLYVRLFCCPLAISLRVQPIGLVAGILFSKWAGAPTLFAFSAELTLLALWESGTGLIQNPHRETRHQLPHLPVAFGTLWPIAFMEDQLFKRMAAFITSIFVHRHDVFSFASSSLLRSKIWCFFRR